MLDLPNGVNLTRDCMPIKGLKGLYYDGNIIIDKSVETNAELRCVVAEELGHHHTSHGDILDYNKHAKQELKARDWAVKNLVALDDFVHIFEKGCRNKFEAAEELDITEDFFLESIEYYRRKYGSLVEYKGYVIYFEPLGVMKRSLK